MISKISESSRLNLQKAYLNIYNLYLHKRLSLGFDLPVDRAEFHNNTDLQNNIIPPPNNSLAVSLIYEVFAGGKNCAIPV